MVNESNIQPVVLLSKSDLLPVYEIDKKITEIQAVIPGIRVVPFSNKDQTGLQHVKELLVPWILVLERNCASPVLKLNHLVTLWEVLAVPDIRVQAEKLVHRLIGDK